MSNAHILRRIAWKEYRQQRAFGLALAGLMVFVQLLIAVFSTARDNPWENLLATALVGTALYALGCGATMFAAEHENETYEFQRSLPISAGRLMAGKMEATLLGTGGILLLLLGTASLLGWLAGLWHELKFPAPSGKEVKELVSVPGLAVFEMLAWGTLFSLLLKRPLPAALLAVTAWSASLHPFYYLYGLYDDFWKNYLCIVPERLVILAVVAAADVRLGLRWLREENWLTRRRNRLGRHSMLEMPAEAIIPEVESASRWKILGRLVWQSWRQTVWMTVAVTVLLLAASAVAFFAPHRENPVSLWGILIAMPLWTQLFFRDDRVGYRLRYLAEHGVSPTMVWFGRQAAGLLPVAIIVLIGFAVCSVLSFMFGYSLIGPEGHISHLFRIDLQEEFFKNPFLLGWLPGLFFIYSVVQFCSLFFRSGILAGFFSLILTVPLLLWSALMAYWTVPWWWSIAPAPLLLLLATWLRMPGWLLERRGFRSWLRPALALLPLAAIVIGVPFYRVYSIPLVTPNYSESEIVYLPTPEGQKTAELYQQALGEYRNIETKEPQGTREEPTNRAPDWGPPPPLSQEEQEWLAGNKKSIQLMQEASRRPQCDFPCETSHAITYERWKISDYLGKLLTCRARQLATEGRPEGAWDCCLSSLRMADHFEQGNTLWSYYVPIHLRKMAYEQLLFWAAHERVTSQDVRKAIAELQRLPITGEGLREATIRDYVANRTYVEKNEDYPVGNESYQFRYRLWSNLLSWEKYRVERLLSIQLNADLADHHTMENNLLTDQPVDTYQGYYRHIHATSMPFPYNLFLGYSSRELEYDLNQWIQSVTLYRITQIRLAMIAWKKEHGKYPDKLEQIAAYFDGKIPRDPYSGEAFGYVPEGFCSPQIILTALDASNQKWNTLAAGRPFLWSVGERIRKVFYSLSSQEWPGQKRYSIIEKEGPYRLEDVEMYGPQTDAEVWANGICYPLP
jgi:hypothetical protein